MWTMVLWIGIVILGVLVLISWFFSGAKAKGKDEQGNSALPEEAVVTRAGGNDGSASETAESADLVPEPDVLSMEVRPEGASVPGSCEEPGEVETAVTSEIPVDEGTGRMAENSGNEEAGRQTEDSGDEGTGRMAENLGYEGTGRQAEGSEGQGENINDTDDEPADLPIPVAGMTATVTDPIPGRGYGEIRVTLGGIDYYFMAACDGEDWVPLSERVIVVEMRDGVIYVQRPDDAGERAAGEVDNG